MVNVDERLAWGKIDGQVVRSALHELDRRLTARFGGKYLKLILFGSRARGDNEPDGDADEAVVMRGPIGNRWWLQRAIAEDTYDILLETGLYVEPWPVDEDALRNPEVSANPELTKEIVRDGITP